MPVSSQQAVAHTAQQMQRSSMPGQHTGQPGQRWKAWLVMAVCVCLPRPLLCPDPRAATLRRARQPSPEVLPWPAPARGWLMVCGAELLS